MRKYSLDLLRGCAAFLVAIPHFIIVRGSGSTFPDAVTILAVEVFFLLSGFVLAPQLLYCLEGGGWWRGVGRIKIFLIRRWMRTLPPFILALTIVSILAREIFTKEFFSYLFFVNNFYAMIEKDYFQVAWSLSIEEWFYIFFPPFLLACKLLRVSLWKSCVLFIATFFVSRAFLAVGSQDAIFEVRRLVLFRLDSICFGFALYLALQKISVEDTKRKILLLVSALASSIVAVNTVRASLSGSAFSAIAYFVVAPIFAATLLSAFYAAEEILFRGKAVRVISKYFGDISYGVYLFHIPVIMLMQDIPTSDGVGLFIFVCAVVLLSTLVRVFFENPILRERPNYKDNFVAATHDAEIDKSVLGRVQNRNGYGKPVDALRAAPLFIFRRWKSIGVVFFVFLTIEICAYFAAEHIGAPRKEAMLRGMVLDKDGKETPSEALGVGRDNQYLSAEERKIFAKEYSDVVDKSVYAQRTMFNFAPNYTGKFIITDERGFRVVPEPQQPTKMRVAFLGGSVAWGIAAETNADTIPAKFQTLSEGRFKAINYGMGGYSSVENVLMLNSILVRDHKTHKIDAVIVSDIWNDCIPVIARLTPNSPFASDGLGPAVSGHLSVFVSELRREGMLIFSPKQSFMSISQHVSSFFTSTLPNAVRQVVERERVWRLIRLIRDPEFVPWFCCGKEEVLPDPLASISPDEYAPAIEASLDVLDNNLAMMRALSHKHGIRIFFSINPMAFTKRNPAPGESVSTPRDKLYEACYARARSRLGNSDDVFDMSDTPMPDERVFADTGHMNRLGNEAYAAELLRKIGPKIQRH